LDIFDRVQFIFLLKRARPNVRAKWDGVNSVFLVQLRKMMAGDFLGSERIKKSVEDVLPSRWQRGIRIADGRAGRNAVESRGRLCTEGAQEMQKGGGQWAVVSGQFWLQALRRTTRADAGSVLGELR